MLKRSTFRSPSHVIENVRKRKLCVGAVRGGGYAAAMCENMLTSIPASWKVDAIYTQPLDYIQPSLLRIYVEAYETLSHL